VKANSHTRRAWLAIADVLQGMNRKKFRLIEYNASLNVLFLPLLLAFSAARALGQCAGKVSSPAAAADCAARETPRKGTAILDPLHPYTLAELIDVAEHHNPSTRTIWERAKQKARELGLAKSAYYPELEGLAVFGDQRSIDPFPKPLAPRGYTMVEVPIVPPEATSISSSTASRDCSIIDHRQQSLPVATEKLRPLPGVALSFSGDGMIASLQGGSPFL
jgi:hypothetical protein